MVSTTVFSNLLSEMSPSMSTGEDTKAIDRVLTSGIDKQEPPSSGCGC